MISVRKNPPEAAAPGGSIYSTLLSDSTISIFFKLKWTIPLTSMMKIKVRRAERIKELAGMPWTNMTTSTSAVETTKSSNQMPRMSPAAIPRRAAMVFSRQM